MMFSRHLNDYILGHSQIRNDQGNNWVWFPESKGTKLSAMIYSHFNQFKTGQNSWKGWSILWRLKIAPRVKHFLWLMFHNAVITQEYLYKLNLGPQTLCCFCNLNPESVEHLFLTCSKTQEIWNLISNAIRKPIHIPNGISSGNWLNQEFSGNDIFTQSVIATTVWFIWKARCKLIFSNAPLNNVLVSSQATGQLERNSYSITHLLLIV